MDSIVTEEDISNHLALWQQWRRQKEPRGDLLSELREIQVTGPNGLRGVMWMFIHLKLWLICRIFLLLHIPRIARFAAKARIKFDNLWYEPKSCGLNHSWTDLGISFLQSKQIDEAIDCLYHAWHVLPCPHNMSYGLSRRLSQRLAKHTSAENAVAEYQRISEQFKLPMKRSMT